jgi:hypothetical protein
MRSRLFGALIVALAASSSLRGYGSDKPIKNTTPLSADEVAIYRAVLQQYISRGSGSLNVAATTYPLDPTSGMNHLSDSECLQGIQLENLAGVSRSFHDLTPEVLPAKNMKLVNPTQQGKTVRANDPDKTIRGGKSVDSAVSQAFATAMFSMSEIAFDKEHRNAVVAYRFWCGSLCGNGATLVLEKVGGQWKVTNRNCGGWVS